MPTPNLPKPTHLTPLSLSVSMKGNRIHFPSYHCEGKANVYRTHNLLKINFYLKKMMMCVDIISREIIRPSSLPIHHLKPFKLSLLDQFTPTTYVLLILFYSKSPQTSMTDHLKNSLSKTLNSFYPFSKWMKVSQIKEKEENCIFSLICKTKYKRDIYTRRKIGRASCRERVFNWV